MLKVTTESGAIYYIRGERVEGGSKNLIDGRLLVPVMMGAPLMISTPERHRLNPDFQAPGVLSTPVVKIEGVIVRE